jgi:murein DD-endopeptidase MepM/ murein hydrolase activator NlpD
MRSKPLQSFVLRVVQKSNTPIKISFQPVPVILGLLILGGIPGVWMGWMLYSLQQQNQVLSQSATKALGQLASLDEEVEELKRRAKLTKKRWQPFTLPPRVGRGGAGILFKPEEQWQLVQKRLPEVAARFKNEVKPELEGTLQKEAAHEASIPRGMPTHGAVIISSVFGVRTDPFGWGGEFHNGVDLIGPHGSPIHATADGVVERAEDSGGYGNHIVLRHQNGHHTLYAHLSSMAVHKNGKVRRGQVVGTMGSTGRSTGTHLHYGLFYRDKAVDPKPYMVRDLEVTKSLASQFVLAEKEQFGQQ